MEVFDSDIHQVFVKLLDGKHRILTFNSPSISVSVLKRRIQTLTSVPSDLQLLLFNNSFVLHDQQTLILAQSSHNTDFSSQLIENDGLGKFPVVVHLLLRLRGGKGGFGSLLRGAAKTGQKKTNNFDACRDMNGRRLRHVNAEKRLEEWTAEAEERKLEKMADDFIKEKTKELVKSGKSNGGNSAEKYVAKYREDSAKCMEKMERSVRESIEGFVSSKRKSHAEGSELASKRLKKWLGKRNMGDSDSEDLDKDGSDEEEEKENGKSVVIDNESNSNSSKEAKASSGSISVEKLGAVSLGRGISGSGSEKEDTVSEVSLKLDESLDGRGHESNNKKRNNPVLESLEKHRDHNEVVSEVPNKSYSSKMDEIVSHQPGISSADNKVSSAAGVENSCTREAVQEESVSETENLQNLDSPLKFDEYKSAAELEVLGLERLKSELQARGLKCGGTLQERAARLFLLKTTPLETLPKKLFAKR